VCVRGLRLRSRYPWPRQSCHKPQTCGTTTPHRMAQGSEAATTHHAEFDKPSIVRHSPSHAATVARAPPCRVQ